MYFTTKWDRAVQPADPVAPEKKVFQMQCKCLTCGKEFNRKPSKIKRSAQIFCSLKCKSDTIARFWRSIQKTDTCWLWIGSLNGDWYGKFRPERGTVSAHRYSWQLHHGPIPDGLCVCHSCPGGDNPRCVNPDHLFLGTQTENMADGVKKHQFCEGEDRFNAKLNKAQVRYARKLRLAGIRYTEMTKIFNVRPNTIRAAVIGETWKHLV